MSFLQVLTELSWRPSLPSTTYNLFEMTLKKCFDITASASPSDSIGPGCWRWKIETCRGAAAPGGRGRGGTRAWWCEANDSIIWYDYLHRRLYVTSEWVSVSFLCSDSDWSHDGCTARESETVDCVAVRLLHCCKISADLEVTGEIL